MDLVKLKKAATKAAEAAAAAHDDMQQAIERWGNARSAAGAAAEAFEQAEALETALALRAGKT
jgi:hypothetical protein